MQHLKGAGRALVWLAMGFLCGCLTVLGGFLWVMRGTGFFTVRGIEIAHLVSPVAAAIFVAVYINRRLATFFKRRDTVCALLDDLKKAVVEILTLGLEYMGDQDMDKTCAIDRAVRHAGSLVMIVADYSGTDGASELGGLDVESLKREFLALKVLLTGNPYKTKKRYSETQKEQFVVKYETIMTRLYKAILGIYSR